MRLIDADDLIERIKEQYKPQDNNAVTNEIVGDIIHNLIEEVPTAYDLSKVIEQLANKITPNEDAVTGEPLNNPCICCETETIEECIGIVRSGVMKE